MGRTLEIKDGLSAEEMRVRAAREKKNRTARRTLALAKALAVMSRADSALAAGLSELTTITFENAARCMNGRSREAAARHRSHG